MFALAAVAIVGLTLAAYALIIHLFEVELMRIREQAGRDSARRR